MAAVTHSRLLEQRDRDIIRLYAEGRPLADIASELDDSGALTANHVAARVSRLRDAGFDIPSRRPRAAAGRAQAAYSRQDDETIISMYGKGATNAAISATLGRTYGAISTRLMALKREGRIADQRPRPDTANVTAAPEPVQVPIEVLSGRPDLAPPVAAPVVRPVPAPTPPAIQPVQPEAPAARIAALLHHVDGSRPGKGHRPLTAEDEAILTARPDLARRVGDRYRLTAEGRQYARAHDSRPTSNPDANEVYRRLQKIMHANDDDVVQSAKAGGLEVAKSRVAGWRRHPSDSRHSKMSMAELLSVMDGFLSIERNKNSTSDDEADGG